MANTKMKLMKQLIYLIATAFLFAGCKKEVPHFFEESPDDRMAARISELKTGLLSAPNGWKAHLTTSAKGGYGFYMQFSPTEVTMVGDLNETTATQPQSSTWRIKWVMYPTLIFDTYNYIAMLQDPTPATYGGNAGSGLQSDVEFEYQYSNGDTIVLRGFKYRNYFILVKATAEEKNRYLSNAYKDNIEAINDFFTNNSNNYIELPGLNNKVELVFDKSTKTVKFQYVDNEDNVKQVSGKYNFEDVGVNFAAGFTLGGVTFVKGKLEDGKFVLYAADGTKYIVNQSPNPILPMSMLFAYNGTYKELYIGSSLAPGVTSGWNAVYNASVTKFAAMNPTRTLVDIRFILTNSTKATVTIRNSNGTTTYTANATYDYTYDNGVITLSNPSYDGNWTARVAQLIDIQNYFESGGPFRVDYVTSTDPSVTGLGGLYRVADATSFFYGTLRK
jgi:hypothetical protein